MASPVILVSGSTDGIGKATARELAVRGAEVIFHGRDRKKGEQVIRELKRMIWNRNLDLVTADYSDMAQVHRMAEEISSRYSSLDVLINNAGTYEPRYHLTSEGIETTFAVNYLAPFLLTHQITPLLKRSGNPRVVNISSIDHHEIREVDWENLQGEKRYDPFHAYALSQLAIITFTYLFAQKFAELGISVNCLHPGTIATRMLRMVSPGIRGKAPVEGARLPVYLAVSPDVAGVTGKYFEGSMQPGRSSDLSMNPLIQERMWKVAEQLTSSIQ